MKAKVNKNKARFTPLTIVMLVFLCAYSITLIGLLFWGILTALSPEDVFEQIRIPSFKSVTFKNFADIIQLKIKPADSSFGLTSIPQTILFSALYSVGSSFFKTAVTCLTAYFAAIYKFKYSKIVYFTVLLVMMIPIVGNLPSEILTSKGYLFSTFDIFNGNNELRTILAPYGNMWGQYIMKASFVGLYFLIFYEFFASLPKSYFESAKIDGGSNLQILVRIAIPLASSLFFTIFLIHFVEYWNDYQAPMVYLKGYPTISYVIFNESNYSASLQGSIPKLIALSVFGVLPTLIVFLFTHKKMMSNLTVGGIKG